MTPTNVGDALTICRLQLVAFYMLPVAFLHLERRQYRRQVEADMSPVSATCRMLLVAALSLVDS